MYSRLSLVVYVSLFWLLTVPLWNEHLGVEQQIPFAFQMKTHHGYHRVSRVLIELLVRRPALCFCLLFVFTLWCHRLLLVHWESSVSYNFEILYLCCWDVRIQTIRSNILRCRKQWSLVTFTLGLLGVLRGEPGLLLL